tara:strand:- start:1496 stop:5911 length:4416 start_codon:yes stop_codon:yes gene_type:complete
MAFLPKNNTNNVNTSAEVGVGTPVQDEVFYNERNYTDQLAQQTKEALESRDVSETIEIVAYDAVGQSVTERETDSSSGTQNIRDTSETAVPVEPEEPPPAAPASVTVEASDETTAEGQNPAGPHSPPGAPVIEPIAIFNQKVTDFLQDSRAVAALEKSYVESKISDKFVERILTRAKEEDSEVFSSAMSAVDTELSKASDVLDAILQILQAIRDFDGELKVTSNTVIRNMCLQYIADESIKIDELISSTDVFGNLLRICDQHFVDEYDKLPEKSVTALSKSALSAVRFYLDKGYTTSQLLYQKEVPPHNQTNAAPGVEPDPKGRPFSAPGVLEVGARVSSVGTPFDQQESISEMDNAGLGIFCDNPLFEALDAYAQTNIKIASVLLSMVSSEMLVSAGLGRLEGTTLGNKFSTTSAFRKNLLGVSTTGTTILSNFPEPGSIASILTANRITGEPGITGNTGQSSMILDGKFRDGDDPHYTSSSATSGFTKTIITDPTKNTVSGYEKALDNADEVSTLGVQFFEKLQARDKDISLLTPSKLFIRVMEEINTSISSFAVGFDAANKSRCAELSMYSYLGGVPVNADEREYAEKMRALLFSAMARQCFSILQKQNIKILANSSETGKPTVTEVTVKDEDGTSVTKTITTKDKSGAVDSNKVVLDTSVLRFSGDDTANFVKTSEIPIRSFLGARFAGTGIPEDTINIWDNIGNPNNPNDTFQQQNTQTQTSGQEVGPGPGGAVGQALEEPLVSSAQESEKEDPTEGSAKTSTSVGANVLWNTKIFDLFTELEQDTNSLTSRLAKVFVECHKEAQKIARSDDDSKNFIVPSARVTKASGIDGATLVSMIFHAATKLANTFSNCRIIKPSDAASVSIHGEDAPDVWPEGDLDATGQYLVNGVPINEEEWTKEDYENLDNPVNTNFPTPIYDDKGAELAAYYDYLVGKADPFNYNIGSYADATDIAMWWQDATVSAQGTFGFGDANHNKRIHDALTVILTAAKSNDLGAVYDKDGKIIGVGQSNRVISARNTVTYKQLENLIKSLSRSHRQPYAALLSHLSQIRYVKEKSKSVVNLGMQVSSNPRATQSQTVESFLEFYNNFKFGQEYVENITDYRIQITSDKIRNIETERATAGLKRQKITKGELNSLKPIFDILGSSNVGPGHPKDMLIVCAGIPTGYTEHTLEHNFDIVEGLSAVPNIPTVDLMLIRFSGLTDDFKGKMTKSFLLESILSSESFAPFENIQPGSMGELEEKILVHAGKENQTTALNWINQWENNPSKKHLARKVMRTEIKSFLMKRFLSALSPVDLDVRDMVPGLDSRFQNADSPRYSGSKELAKTLSLVAGYPSNTFDEVFQEQEGVVTLNPVQMQMLTAYQATTTSTGQLTHFPKISYAFADLFTDVFSALPFRAGYLMNEIFAPNDYEKIVCFEVDKNHFLLAGGVHDNAIPKSPNSTVDPGFVGFHTYVLQINSISKLPKP